MVELCELKGGRQVGPLLCLNDFSLEKNKAIDFDFDFLYIKLQQRLKGVKAEVIVLY